MKQFYAKDVKPTVRTVKCRDKQLVIGKKTLIMGILNITPDSFSDGGRFNSLDAAVARAEEMVRQGADLIDIGGESTRPIKVYGGESTRPGYVPVSNEEEISRIVPVIEAVSQTVDVPISVDTYKAEVAEAALKAGAHIINDIWGLKHDQKMAATAAQYGAAVVLMHNRKEARYDELMSDVAADLRESIRLAHEAGIADDQIILDPGIGFAKTIQDNYQVMNHLSEIAALGYPVLLGTSRKSMIWKTLDLPTDQIVEGTIATVVMGLLQGCSIMRVHDVEEVSKACRLMDAIVRAGGGNDDG